MLSKVFSAALSEGCGLTRCEVSEILAPWQGIESVDYSQMFGGFSFLHLSGDPIFLFEQAERLANVHPAQQERLSIERKLIREIGRRIIETSHREVSKESFLSRREWDACSSNARGDRIKILVNDLYQAVKHNRRGGAKIDYDALCESPLPVLPHAFGPPAWTDLKRPNCVGIAIVLAGILRHVCGLAPYAALPLNTDARSIYRFSQSAMAQLAECAVGCPSELSELITGFVGVDRDTFIDSEFDFSQQHLGLCVDVTGHGLFEGKKDWLLADPNWDLAEQYPIDWALTLGEYFIDKFRDSYPGLAISTEGSLPLQNSPKRLEHYLVELNAIGEVLKRYREVDWNSICSLEAALRGTELEQRLCGDELLKGVNDPYQRAALIAWAIEPGEDSSWEQMLKTRDPSLAKDTVLKRLRHLPLLRLVQAMNRFNRDSSPEFYFTGELLDLDMAVGILVCTHLGYVFNCFEETQAMLARHTNSQWQTLYAATRHLRENRPGDETAKSAVAALRRIPRRFQTYGVLTAILMEDLNDE